MTSDEVPDVCNRCERPLSEAQQVVFYADRVLCKPCDNIEAAEGAEEARFGLLFDRAFEEAYRDGRELTAEDIRVWRARARMVLE